MPHSANTNPRFDDVPELDIHLLDRPDLASAGAGETPIIAIAPAIANAVFRHPIPLPFHADCLRKTKNLGQVSVTPGFSPVLIAPAQDFNLFQRLLSRLARPSRLHLVAWDAFATTVNKPRPFRINSLTLLSPTARSPDHNSYPLAQARNTDCCRRHHDIRSRTSTPNKSDNA
jgi:hypothetical protein